MVDKGRCVMKRERGEKEGSEEEKGDERRGMDDKRKWTGESYDLLMF